MSALKNSIKYKLITLSKPSNIIKLVKVQQDEVKRIQLIKKIRTNHTFFIEQLYEHYIVQNKSKTYIKC